MNRERIQEQRRNYRQVNRKRIEEQDRSYYQVNRERIQEKRSGYDDISFLEDIQKGPTNICISCGRLWFDNSVKLLTFDYMLNKCDYSTFWKVY